MIEVEDTATQAATEATTQGGCFQNHGELDGIYIS
jgi:hypothetical protein